MALDLILTSLLILYILVSNLSNYFYTSAANDISSNFVRDTDILSNFKCYIYTIKDLLIAGICITVHANINLCEERKYD